MYFSATILISILGEENVMIFSLLSYSCESVAEMTHSFLS